jgi:hypothetical protein
MRRFYLAWIICFAITASRDIDALLKPILWTEDGAAIWSHYYNVTTIIPPVRYYGGYISLISDIVGYVVSYFPTRWQPHMFPAIALSMSSASFALFASPPFRKVVENDNQRLVVAVGLAALPLGSGAKATFVAFSQWPAGAALCLLVALAPRLNFGLVLLMTIIVWTNPISALLLPFFAYEAWRRRSDLRDSIGWVVLLAAGLSYLWLGRTYDPTHPHIYKGIVAGTTLILERGIAETVLGTGVRMWMLNHWHWAYLDVVGLAALCLTAVALRDRLRDPAFLAFAVKLMIMGAVICYLSAVLRDEVGLETPWGRRYAFTLSIAFAILALIAITDAVRAGRPLFQQATLAALFVAAMTALNYQNNGLYKSLPESWPRFHAFLENVVAAEKSGVAQRLILEGQEREGWPILINVRPRH